MAQRGRPRTRAQYVAPPGGVEARAPDDVKDDSILNYAAPTMEEVVRDEMRQGDLSNILDQVDIAHLEKRTTLLARLIIEQALWDRDQWSKKERVDAAINAIKLFEGTKSQLWVHDEDDVKMPKSEEEFEKEKDELEKRLVDLFTKDKDLRKVKGELTKDVNGGKNG